MTMLTRSGLRMMDEYRRRMALRRLADQDDRMLADMGLTRGEIDAALSLPMSVDARDAAHAGSRLALGLPARNTAPRGVYTSVRSGAVSAGGPAPAATPVRCTVKTLCSSSK
ncbi:MAG: DUF1127 domain-containing protein [Pseudomonadota bacterium]